MFCEMMDTVNTLDEFCAQSIPHVKLLLFLSLPPRLTFQNYFFSVLYSV